ncbi:MAG: CDP-alcohol phosphatidyltransferase family protein [Anaerotignum sp.]|nr:CDP-alcohol phosphatidyltransferase family protein [Anaerotignum sp.]
MGVVPNVITIARMVGSILLLWVEPFSRPFFALYLCCGISDALDGYIARKFQLSSALGATLDSLADCFFVFITLYVLLPVVAFPRWVLFWIGEIFLIKGCTFLIGMLRYRALAFLHTYLNKITGAILFGFPVLYYFGGIEATSAMLCGIATLAAVEELAINLSKKELQRDRKSLFMK